MRLPLRRAQFQRLHFFLGEEDFAWVWFGDDFGAHGARYAKPVADRGKHRKPPVRHIFFPSAGR
jgi:hypothetical protein